MAPLGMLHGAEGCRAFVAGGMAMLRAVESNLNSNLNTSSSSSIDRASLGALPDFLLVVSHQTIYQLISISVAVFHRLRHSDRVHRPYRGKVVLQWCYSGATVVIQW